MKTYKGKQTDSLLFVVCCLLFLYVCCYVVMVLHLLFLVSCLLLFVAICCCLLSFAVCSCSCSSCCVGYCCTGWFCSHLLFVLPPNKDHHHVGRIFALSTPSWSSREANKSRASWSADFDESYRRVLWNRPVEFGILPEIWNLPSKILPGASNILGFCLLDVPVYFWISWCPSVFNKRNLLLQGFSGYLKLLV